MIGIAELIVLAIIALPIIALVDIVRSDFKDSNNKLMWVIIVLLLPILGTILYFVVGRGQKVSA